MIAIGIDVGGTRIRVGAIDDASTVLAARELETARIPSADSLVAALHGAVGAVVCAVQAERGTTVGIGLALPGPVDRKRGLLTRSLNLAFLEGCPIVDEMTERTGYPVTLCTDAEAAVWGEYTARQPRPDRFVHLRLGTGVACGVVINGRMEPPGAATPLGVGCRTAHLEVLVIDDGPEAVPCRCGKRGCLETMASGWALARRAREAGLSGQLTALRQAQTEGDNHAAAIIRDAAAGVAAAIRNLTVRFAPNVITLGGGVVEQLPEVFEEAVKPCGRISATQQSPERRRRVGPRGRADCERATLGDRAGIIGAALLAMRQP